MSSIITSARCVIGPSVRPSVRCGGNLLRDLLSDSCGNIQIVQLCKRERAPDKLFYSFSSILLDFTFNKLFKTKTKTLISSFDKVSSDNNRLNC